MNSHRILVSIHTYILTYIKGKCLDTGYSGLNELLRVVCISFKWHIYRYLECEIMFITLKIIQVAISEPVPSKVLTHWSPSCPEHHPRPSRIQRTRIPYHLQPCHSDHIHTNLLAVKTFAYCTLSQHSKR